MLPGVGTLGVAAAFSFYGNKNMTTAEGGAILAGDEKLRDGIRRARGHGLTSGTFQRRSGKNPIYDVTMLGFNYRLDELRAAIGLVQLGHVQRWNAKRKDLAQLYRRSIEARCPMVTVPFDAGRASVHHIMPVLLPRSAERQNVIDRLREAGIQTTIHYPPTHRLSFYRDLYPNCRYRRRRTLQPANSHSAASTYGGRGRRDRHALSRGSFGGRAGICRSSLFSEPPCRFSIELAP